jgi:N-acetylglucosaminyldiphosphoundecaprenol N-acetyl-beta-D-mannosaminyltransferase
MTSVRIPRLGVSVTPMDALAVAELVRRRADEGSGLMIANYNLHAVYMHHVDTTFASYCQLADVRLIDGLPVLLAIPAAQRPGRAHRVGSTDWLDELLRIDRPLSIAAIGGTFEASRLAQERVERAHPHIEWHGIPGYGLEDASRQEELLAAVRHSQVVLVGMGMPRQEHWIMQNLELLAGKVVANVGGCFDYYAGTQALAPRWMGRIGVEWIYRLLRSPRRLFRRYLIEPFKLAAVLHRKRGGVANGKR